MQYLRKQKEVLCHSYEEFVLFQVSTCRCQEPTSAAYTLLNIHTKYLQPRSHNPRPEMKTDGRFQPIHSRKKDCIIHQVASSHHCIIQHCEARCHFKENAKNRLDETVTANGEFIHGRNTLPAELYQKPHFITITLTKYSCSYKKHFPLIYGMQKPWVLCNICMLRLNSPKKTNPGELKWHSNHSFSTVIAP